MVRVRVAPRSPAGAVARRRRNRRVGPGGHAFPAGVAPQGPRRAGSCTEMTGCWPGSRSTRCESGQPGPSRPATPMPGSDEGAPSKLSGPPTSYRGDGRIHRHSGAPGELAQARPPGARRARSRACGSSVARVSGVERPPSARPAAATSSTWASASSRLRTNASCTSLTRPGFASAKSRRAAQTANTIGSPVQSRQACAEVVHVQAAAGRLVGGPQRGVADEHGGVGLEQHRGQVGRAGEVLRRARRAPRPATSGPAAPRCARSSRARPGGRPARPAAPARPG